MKKHDLSPHTSVCQVRTWCSTVSARHTKRCVDILWRFAWQLAAAGSYNVVAAKTLAD